MSFEPPANLFITFEDGVHVGVFRDAAGAERLNADRRKKKRVDPEVVHYVPIACMYEAAEAMRQEWIADRETTKAERNAALKERDALAKQYVDMKTYAEHLEIKLEAALAVAAEMERAAHRP